MPTQTTSPVWNLTKSSLTLLLCLSTFFTAPMAHARQSSIEQQLNEFQTSFQELKRSSSEHGLRLDPSDASVLFARHIGDTLVEISISQIEDQLLSKLFEALTHLLFSADLEPAAELLHTVVDELDRRSVIPDFIQSHTVYDHPAQLAHTLYINGRFNQLADMMEASFPEHVDPFPIEINASEDLDTSKPAILFPKETGAGIQFMVQSLSMDHGSWFIGVVHPDCHFSRQVMQWLENDEEAANLLSSKTAVWVSSQNRTRDWRRLQNWNAQAELIRVVLAYRNDAWPREVLLGLTPTFYVLKDGVVVEILVGWPGKERADDLMAMLERFAEQ